MRTSSATKRLGAPAGRLGRVLRLWAPVLLAAGCTTQPSFDFDAEWQLSMKAGKGQLSESEKQDLLQRNHPLLAQLGDPATRQMLEHFARLPEADLNFLKAHSYLKWHYAELDEDRRRLHREMLGFVQGVLVRPESVPAKLGTVHLEAADVGFAVVELPGERDKVISWFAIWPDHQAPVWVTLVNSPAGESVGYDKAHWQRLAMIRAMRSLAAPRRDSAMKTLVTSTADLLAFQIAS